jgi:hypothetical protein
MVLCRTWIKGTALESFALIIQTGNLSKIKFCLIFPTEVTVFFKIYYVYIIALSLG